MSDARDPDPVRPSEEATLARQQAVQAAEEAEAHRQEQVEKLAEAATELARLVGHRRANRFTELFREALDRTRGGDR
jgi:hypothetical protein